MLVKMVNMFWAFIMLLPFFCEYDRIVVNCQLVNKPPHFIPGSGDMSRFSLPENTPVDTPVYQLKGN